MKEIPDNNIEGVSNFIKPERPSFFVGNHVRLINPDQEFLDENDQILKVKGEIRVSKMRNIPEEGWVVCLEGFKDLEFPANIFEKIV